MGLLALVNSVLLVFLGSLGRVSSCDKAGIVCCAIVKYLKESRTRGFTRWEEDPALLNSSCHDPLLYFEPIPHGTDPVPQVV